MSKLVGVRVEGKHGDGRMLVRSIIAAKSIRNSAREIDGEKDKDKDKDGYNDKEEEGTKSIGIRPGMIMEIAAPPGGGKTSMCVDLAIEARRGESGAEVLLVGESGRYCRGGGEERKRYDMIADLLASSRCRHGRKSQRSEAEYGSRVHGQILQLR